MSSTRPIIVKIPTRVGNTYTPATVWQGRKKLGALCSRPKVLQDNLYAGKYILVTRGLEHMPEVVGPETLKFFTNGLGKYCMEVRYGDDYATYELRPEAVYWSDGPPHPDHLQLGARISSTAGVKEPEVP